MNNIDNPSVFHRNDYVAPNFAIDQVYLDFSLNPNKTIVKSTLQMRRLSPGSLVLRGEDLELISISVNNEDYRQFELNSKELILHHLPEAFELEITSSNQPNINTSLMGLYVSNDNFFTQCEAEGFRKITYFLDQPDVLSKYTVKLSGSKVDYPVLLSNGNLIEEGELNNGWHFAVWEDPFLKPSYLFALVAGKLEALERHYVTNSGEKKLLQIWVEKKDLSRTAHAMESLVHSIEWDEKRFGLELDLERFMIVAVGDFNMGAMENKGLNIFNTKYVLADQNTATDTDFANIESVVGHEYFHNWTGNRVTCRDWFQLSLKEGLTVFRDQEFSADLMGSASGRAVKRIEDVRLLRQVQFPEDAGPMAHPIRPDSYQEINNFYTVTVYEKGAEVVRMLHTLLGEDGFMKGMKLYFQRHDGQAVTCDDFLACMADANDFNATQFKHWYSQAGTPRVQVREHFDEMNKTYTIQLSQSCPPSPNQLVKEAFHIPLKTKLLFPSQSTAEFLIELQQTEQEIVLKDIHQKPILSINRDFSAPIILDFDQNEHELLFIIGHDDNAFSRWEAIQKIASQNILNNRRPSHQLIEAYRHLILDPDLDPAFKELCFTLPAETYLHEQLVSVDPQLVHQAKTKYQNELALALKNEWLNLYQQNLSTKEYSPNPIDAGKRALKNFALKMLLEANKTDHEQRAFEQLNTCDNMTDFLAALTLLVHFESTYSAQALELYYQRHQENDLALDKWFAIQATKAPISQRSMIEDIRQLKQHSAFKIRNPNRVRSVIHTFCMNNPAGFHEITGQGYEFWYDNVLELDGINPQVAARLARGLDRWKKFKIPYQTMMHSQLEKLLTNPLSNDVKEVIQKALI